ncbi:response regulator transcription factor [Microbacterium sp. p3-SID336]|uniref:response regulator n=1 Tax=Microbacterium sp. p3-SID336 TaxID=2916212 RepID=UPI0021A47AB4|nr:response regulator transcription factor [Microbacterium sp. p3-SID336]MCT1478847.1 response regulator transcription factor [Microbacterium sp. p3-SID336]
MSGPHGDPGVSGPDEHPGVTGPHADSGVSAPHGQGRLRVVVCDDQELVRTGFITIIDAQPDMVVVGEAENGEEAVRVTARERPDVVVMDIRMPLLDGIEATRRIAGPEVDAPARVLVVTTFSMDSLVFDALRAGASGFLLKDARPAELIAAIRTVAAGDSLIAPAVTRALIGRFGERLRPSAQSSAALDALTAREREVLVLLADGLSNAEIAMQLVISPETVKTYVSRLLMKLGVRDRVQAVVLAHRLGLAS